MSHDRLFNMPNGLVDLDDYLPYLPPDSDSTPLIASAGSVENGPWVHQHVYFIKSIYRGMGDPYRKFCDTSHNQVVMRKEQELRLHAVFQKHVPPPPIEAIQASLTDFDQLDRIGAAVLGKLVAVNPLWTPRVDPNLTVAGLRTKSLSFDRGDFFDNQIEASLKELESPLITPQRVITSAIRRMAKFFDNDELLQKAEERSDDGVFYPLRICRLPRLLDISSLMLAEQEGSEALQTGVNAV